MRVVLSLFVISLVSFGSAVLFPRQLTSEMYWNVRWEHRLTAIDSLVVGERREGFSRLDSEGSPLVITGAGRYSLLSEKNGAIVAAGLMAPQFTFSDEYYINQDTESPRWAVQSWNQPVPQFVDAHGVPAIFGSYLVEVLDRNRMWITDLSVPSPQALALPAGIEMVRYELCDGCEVPRMIRTGFLGELEVISLRESSSSLYQSTVEAFSGAVPIIYGAAATSDDRYVIVEGLTPQSLVALHADGNELVRGVSIPIPEDFAVRREADFGLFPDGHGVVVLNDHIGLFELDEGRISFVESPGVRHLAGHGLAGASYLVVVEKENGVLVHLAGEGEGYEYKWSWADYSVSAFRNGLTGLLLVVQNQDFVVALEVKE